MPGTQVAVKWKSLAERRHIRQHDALLHLQEACGWLPSSGLQKAVMTPTINQYDATWSKAITAGLCTAVGSHKPKLFLIFIQVLGPGSCVFLYELQVLCSRNLQESIRSRVQQLSDAASADEQIFLQLPEIYESFESRSAECKTQSRTSTAQWHWPSGGPSSDKNVLERSC
ncbi:TPA: hypothetical protein ACH3X1_003625 [Trebouxia sp. C0004]